MNDLEDIKNSANLCLNCKNPMCKKGCPIETNIPEFISKIKENKFEEAYKILQENNIMSEICSTVCPTENQCMGKCIRGIKTEPIKINKLEKFVNNWAEVNGIEHGIEIKEKNDIKVAIVGSGPAGIACATELLKEGFEVTIFEKEEKIGGLLEYGIPDFRLPRKTLKKVIEKLIKMGLKLELGKALGKDFSIKDLKEKFKYIFLAIGAGISNTYKLTDEASDNIFIADEFLKSFNNHEEIKNLGNVVVIGGGNVAIDSARAAIRMGATSVTIAYRRNEELMPARKIEIEDAINDGVNIIYLTKVISANLENGKIKGITCIKTKIENNKVIDIENSEFVLEADSIIFAIGLIPDTRLLEQNGITIENKMVKVDENYMTNIEDVFAGGDLVETKSTVCRAIATGKKVSKAIIEKTKNIVYKC